jgi:hypothetical protein
VAKTINVELSTKGINQAIKELKLYKAWVLQKEEELRIRLATLGATVASIKFSGAKYDGVKDVTVRVDDTGSVAVIYAEGEAVAFIEFGTGITYGYGHPQAAQFGVGPGTYPEGKGNWNKPKGWWYGKRQHTYGNPPAMAMYDAVQAMTVDLTRIAREVFQ